MNRTIPILIILSILIVSGASAIATSDQTTIPRRDNINIIKAQTCQDSLNITSVEPNDNVTWGTCADLRIVQGWYGALVHQSGQPVIDVSSFTRTILINKELWKQGDYFQWAEYEEPKGNLFMFTVVSEVPVPVEAKNVTALNVTQVVLPSPFKYNLEQKQIADVLVARGDPLSFNNTKITNLTRAWLFGIDDKIYYYPCEDGRLYLNESLVLTLRPGMYYLLLDNPGANTITEAVWDTEKERIFSPLRATPYLDIPGYSPRVVYDKIVPWLRTYSDDVASIYKVEIQEPFVEITGIGTVYSNRTDVLQVDGYTNLGIGTQLYATIDEIYTLRDIIHPPRTDDKVRGLPERPGVMREFRIYPPFDYENKTAGQHSVTVHGPFKTFSTVNVPVAFMPTGQERPQEYIAYINGSLWNPPVIVTQKVIETVTIRVIERIEIPVTPSNEQVYMAQTKVNWDLWTMIATWAVIVLIVGSISGYSYLVWRRLKK